MSNQDILAQDFWHILLKSIQMSAFIGRNLTILKIT